MGVTVGFSRNTPHDGYFFDHPSEIIAGAIPPPRFNLLNIEAIRRHVGSLVFEHAEAEFPQNLEPFISDEGDLIEEGLKPLCDKLASGADAAVTTANTLWPELAANSAVREAATSLSSRARDALSQRASLIKRTRVEHDKLGRKVSKTASEKRVYEGLGNLVHSLRSDNRYAYLPRVLAESGVLPGYSFPGDPGSVALGYDPDPVFTGRLQAQREFAPGQIVYARGLRWQVGGIAMDRPGAPRAASGSLFNFALCPSCQLANNPQHNVCRRCKTKLGGDEGGDKDFVAWDAGAFQAFPAEMAAEAEEERLQKVFDIRIHPQRDTKSMRYAVGSWFLDLREQEDLWVINHGLQERERLGELPTNEGAFLLCPQCGEYRSVHRHADLAKSNNRSDPKASKDPHSTKCKGEFKPYALGHQMNAATLRLCIPSIESWGEGEAVAWSLLYALLNGAVRAFDIDDADLDCQVLTKHIADDSNKPARRVLDVLWTDRITGGSGILIELAEKLPVVAEAALKHLEGHECPSSCYRCLRSFRNQRVHGLLDWRLARQFLLSLSQEPVHRVGEVPPDEPIPQQSGQEWEDARAVGLESPQELRLYNALLAEGSIPRPTIQHRVVRPDGSLLTRADFAYLDCEPRLLIYVDGLAYHSDMKARVHDQRITNQLQTMGFRVLRFFGFETHHEPMRCVEKIIAARTNVRRA